MDIPRKLDLRKRRLRRIGLGLAGVAVVLATTLGLARLKPAAPEVDRSTVWMDTVKRGSMDIQVRGLGKLVPEQMLWIPAQVDGRVAQKLVLPGMAVKPDTVLLKLTSPAIEQSALDAQWQLKAAEADYNSLKAQLDSKLLDQRGAVATAQSDYLQARLQAERDKQLASYGLGPSLTAQLSAAKAREEVETHALEGVDLAIRPGEYLSVSGPSGCGKSTLLSLIGLLDSPTGGRYWLKSRPVETLNSNERARIRNREVGFIFQSFNLIGDLTIQENVELPLTYRGMMASERKRRVTESLQKVGMGHRVKHYPSQLSGGEQQRVAVARALAGDPAILLADEPTGNLDSKNGDAVMQLLDDLHRQGATICIVTHDPRFAAHAGRVVNLLDGRIVNDNGGTAGTEPSVTEKGEEHDGQIH